MPNEPTPSMRRAPVLPLMGGNVLKLYDNPLYLYPRAEFILTVVVEQEPLKLWDVFAMTSPSQRSQLLSETGIEPESLLPYIVQCFGLWNLATGDGVKRYYASFYDYGPPGESGSVPTHPAWWYGIPAFRPTASIYINGVLKYSLTAADYLAAPVVTFRGSASATQPPTWNDHPLEGIYAYSPPPSVSMPVDSFGRPADRFYLQRDLPGDGTWRGSITVDGHLRMTVQVISMSRDIEIRFGVSQLAVPLPGGWGTTAGSEVEDWDIPSDDPGVWTKVATYRNSCAFPAQDMEPDMAAINGKALETCRSGLDLKQFLASTEYLDVGDFSATQDNERLDWTVPGTARQYGQLHYLRHILFARTDDHYAAMSTESEQYSDTYSPLLVGIDKEGGSGLPGPFTFGISGIYGELDGSPNTGDPKYRTEAKRLMAAAAGRDATSHVYQRPRIKISLRMDIDEQADGDIDQTTTGYAYVDLPYIWSGRTQETQFANIVTDLDPSVNSYDNGSTQSDITDRTTKDWFASGAVLPGSIHFTVLGSRDGVFIEQVPTAGDTLGPLYPGPNSYIYRYDDPASERHYGTWAANQ